MDSITEPRRDILSISRLNSDIRFVLGQRFPLIWVTGEISNIAKPRSGHLYFSLKDQQAQIRCVMFKFKRLNARFEPENGQQIIARAQITVYEARGDMQLNIEQLELAGSGDLQQQFNELKDKLGRQGYFAQERKQALPALPRQIGLITSPSGAAVRDIIAVLKRRFPALPIIIYPTQVQGIQASHEILQALKTAQQRAECDVLMIARGGGSLEDLAAFNNEDLALQIAQSPIPIISAIGHEIDFTIADFVADKRAPTPSAAAELVSPNQLTWFEQLNHFQQRLNQQNNQLLQNKQQQYQVLYQRLIQQKPQNQLQQKAQRLDNLEKQLNQAIQQLYQQQQQRFQQIVHNLHIASPLATMERGYTLVQKADKQQLIYSSKELKTGDKINLRFIDGEHEAKIID